MNRLTLSLLLLFLFAIGTGLGGVVYWKLHTLGIEDTTRTSNKHYYNDEFYFFGLDENGTPLLGELMFQRKQRDTGEYTHYYALELRSEGVYLETMFQEKDVVSDVKARGFLKSFTYAPALDLSTRASYQLSFTTEATPYTLDIATLQGDFLVRNKPNYTKYASMGNGTVTRQGKTIPVRLLHLASYAQDYSEYIYFDGYYQLNSTAHFLVLWDDLGTTYLIDKSIVKSDQTKYRSHTWILRKDSRGMTRKAFAATINYDNDEKPNMWNVSIPTLENTNLILTVLYDNDRATGIAEGTVKDNQGVRKLSGFALITNY